MNKPCIIPGSHPNAGGGSYTGTLTKRSSSRNAFGGRPSTLASTDGLVKDYTKKRWIILALLSTEIESLVTTQYPLETTREALVAILSKGDYGTIGNLGRQYADAMKFLDEDVRQKMSEKQWREQLRNAWEISPALAVFLPQRINHMQILQKEVSRFVIFAILTVLTF